MCHVARAMRIFFGVPAAVRHCDDHSSPRHSFVFFFHSFFCLFFFFSSALFFFVGQCSTAFVVQTVASWFEWTVEVATLSTRARLIVPEDVLTQSGQRRAGRVEDGLEWRW